MAKIDAARLMVPADQELQLCGPIHARWPLRIPGAEERAERSPAVRSSRPDENATYALLLLGGSARHPQSPVEAAGRAVMPRPYASPLGLASFKTRPPSAGLRNRCARRGAPELESRLSLINGIGFELRRPSRRRRAIRRREHRRGPAEISPLALLRAINAGRKTYRTSARPLAGGNSSRAGDLCLPYSAVFIAG